MEWLKKLNRWEFDKIAWVMLHYEDCINCPNNESCSTMETMGVDIPLFEHLKKLFEHNGVEVREVKKNSDNNSKLMLGEPYPGVPELVELNVFYDKEVPELCKVPHYNFFLVHYKDGTNRLHTIRQHLDPVREEVVNMGREGVSCPMFQ